MTLFNPKPMYKAYTKRTGTCQNPECGATFPLDMRGYRTRKYCRKCAKEIRRLNQNLQNRKQWRKRHPK